MVIINNWTEIGELRVGQIVIPKAFPTNIQRFLQSLSHSRWSSMSLSGSLSEVWKLF